MPLRLVMMGTGEFALPTFRALYDAPHEVAGLFTQPDRSGRGHHQHPHPMKELALERGTPVFQPERVNTPEALASLRYGIQERKGFLTFIGEALRDALDPRHTRSGLE